jgi:hypothetical protein
LSRVDALSTPGDHAGAGFTVGAGDGGSTQLSLAAALQHHLQFNFLPVLDDLSVFAQLFQ